VSLGGRAFQGRWGFLGSGERWWVVLGEAETTAAVHGTGRFASEDCEATSYIGWPPRQARVSPTLIIS
jgi:hypothetical protein